MTAETAPAEFVVPAPAHRVHPRPFLHLAARAAISVMSHVFNSLSVCYKTCLRYILERFCQGWLKVRIVHMPTGLRRLGPTLENGGARCRSDLAARRSNWCGPAGRPACSSIIDTFRMSQPTFRAA
jgi:hypothetical protein